MDKALGSFFFLFACFNKTFFPPLTYKERQHSSEFFWQLYFIYVVLNLFSLLIFLEDFWICQRKAFLITEPPQYEGFWDFFFKFKTNISFCISPLAKIRCKMSLFNFEF